MTSEVAKKGGKSWKCSLANFLVTCRLQRGKTGQLGGDYCKLPGMTTTDVAFTKEPPVPNFFLAFVHSSLVVAFTTT